jgi:hypothetical protein
MRGILCNRPAVEMPTIRQVIHRQPEAEYGRIPQTFAFIGSDSSESRWVTKKPVDDLFVKTLR